MSPALIGKESAAVEPAVEAAVAWEMVTGHALLCNTFLTTCKILNVCVLSAGRTVGGRNNIAIKDDDATLSYGYIYLLSVGL